MLNISLRKIQILTTLVIIFFVAACSKPSEEKENQEIIDAKNAVATILKDPKSAEYKGVYLGKDSNGKFTVCGEINSKNSFGGYVGFKMFVYTKEAGVKMFDEDYIGLIQFNKLCASRSEK